MQFYSRSKYVFRIQFLKKEQSLEIKINEDCSFTITLFPFFNNYTILNEMFM